ncbi:MAG TPA: hypothetical protein VG167_20390 [Verrucomicrobiae bacterium]|nr:hypothetical protein [Verrucomicrobiae bacterium]
MSNFLPNFVANFVASLALSNRRQLPRKRAIEICVPCCNIPRVVQITQAGRKLILEVEGWDKLWAFKSRLEVPQENIRSVRADPEVAKGLWKGIRAPGTHLPGVIIAGTYYQHGQRIFWDVKDPEKAIVIELSDERYNELIVEVEEPARTVREIQAMISRDR